MDDSLRELQLLMANDDYRSINNKDKDTEKNAQAKANLLKREREKKVCTKCGRNTKI